MTTWFRSTPLYSLEDKPEVDKENGILRKVAVNTEGPALGHGVEVDSDFVAKVTELGNGWKTGLKARFGHPRMSSEALGTYLGRFKNFRTEERNGKAISFADLHLDESAKDAPGGDLHKYILGLADTAPEEFGTSIVFKPGLSYKKDKDGKKVTVKDFEDSDDYYDLPGPKYATIEKLNGCDAVDEPAANPDGLFSESTIVGQVEQFIESTPKLKELLKRKPEVIEFLDKYTGQEKPENINNPADDAGTEDKLMDLKEFKAKHPALYDQAFEAGVKEERDRVSAHVKLGKESGGIDIALGAIESGDGLTMSLQAEYMSASMNKNALSAREEDNVDVDPKPQETDMELDAKQEAAIKAKLEGK